MFPLTNNDFFISARSDRVIFFAWIICLRFKECFSLVAQKLFFIRYGSRESESGSHIFSLKTRKGSLLCRKIFFFSPLHFVIFISDYVNFQLRKECFLNRKSSVPVSHWENRHERKTLKKFFNNHSRTFQERENSQKFPQFPFVR